MKLPFVGRVMYERDTKELVRQREVVERLLDNADKRVDDLNVALREAREKHRAVWERYRALESDYTKKAQELAALKREQAINEER